MTERKMITEKVDYVSNYEFEGSLQSILERIQDLIKEHGPEAVLDYNANYYYDYDTEPSPRYEIYIKREETDDEVKQRLFFEAEQIRQREEREKAEFERLAKKYGAK
jgi:histidinol dehydrogenase